MATHVDDDTMDGTDARGEPTATDTIESYETEEGVVFYDAENPLAWVETTRTISLKDLA